MKRRRRAALVNTWQSFLVGEICKLSDVNHIGLTKWRTADGQQVWGRVRIRQVTLDHQDAVATLAIDSGGRACYTCRYPGGYPNQTLTPASLGLNASARPLAPTLDPNPPHTNPYPLQTEAGRAARLRQGTTTGTQAQGQRQGPVRGVGGSEGRARAIAAGSSRR